MSAKPLLKDGHEKTNTQEWSIYPPERTAVRSSIVEPISDQRPSAATPATGSGVQQCRYCTETLPPGARECPLCLRDVSDPSTERRMVMSQPATNPGSRLAASTAVPAPPPAAAPLTMTGDGAAAAGEAVYTLESPAQCPECDTEITTINVIRVMRTQVSFTSTLPRKAYVISCPSCRKLLSAGLSGLI
jgi:hypothetical protein